LLGWQTIALIVRVDGLRLHLRILQFSWATWTYPPIVPRCQWRWCRAWWRVLSVAAPLRARWTVPECAWLIGLRVHILWQWRTALVGQTIRGLPLQKRQPSLDVHVGRVEVSRSRVGVKRVTSLVVARFVL
jgi:hypothetical protein